MLKIEQFQADVARSGLVPPEALDRCRAETPAQPDSDAPVRLAKKLVQSGWLTTYQARKLLSGATRGFILGGYKLLKPIGAGGMGKVYLAVNPERERVAIKVLPPRKAHEDEQSLKRFQREMQLSQRCTHPNLARTIAVGNEGDVYFMVMEFIPGQSLYEIVKNEQAGTLRVTDATRLFLKLLDGLEAAHNAHLIHRDIKPSNIMITPEGQVKLLDLGLARALDDETGLTRSNTVLGTLDYASPEQLRDASQADRRSDLYSVGCTLYFALSGSAPFEGGDMINKIFKQRMEEAEPLEKVARGVPTAFAAIVKKLMNKEPDERYQTCAELRADLLRWTDPALVHAILGAEAEAARGFRPPPPELDDDDLRLLDHDSQSYPSLDALSLRNLGTPEPSHAPRYQPPAPPMPAILRPPSSTDTRKPDPRPDLPPDMHWLIQFALIAVALGILAIILISVFFRS
jgi:serine/threonine-protein kinase